MPKKRRTVERAEGKVGFGTEEEDKVRISSLVTLTTLVERVGPLLPSLSAQVRTM